MSAACGESAYRLLDFLGACVFGEVAARAGLESGKERLVVCVRGEDEHLRLRERAADQARRVGALHLGHAQVHQYDVGLGVVCELHSLGAVAGRTDDLDVVNQADEHGEAVADYALVIGDDDPDHAGTSSSTRQPVSVGPACSVPPARSTRSRMPARP